MSINISGTVTNSFCNSPTFSKECFYQREENTMEEKWMIMAKKANFKEIGKRFNISPVLARLIVNRDLKTAPEIERFLYGEAADMHNPHSMKDIEKAASIIEKAIRNNIKVTIASDFDVDGIFSSYILFTAFRKLGGEVMIDTPNRVTEGYGLNKRMVDDAVVNDVGLIVTCDNGIAALEPIAHAKNLGLQVVVTDHHDIPFEEKDGRRKILISEADAIVNPKQNDCHYPFKKLCGAGVAYKLIEVLYERFDVGKENLYELLEYTAIATVADVMDLQDENRIIVKHGLKQLCHTKNTGLRALIEVTGLNPEKISAYHIGFVLGPCFNAAGRLDTVKMALDLLMEADKNKALTYAANLKSLNDSRKDLTVKGFDKAVAHIESTATKQDKILLVKLTDCHESLAGIIAGRIKEKYHQPTMVFTEVGGGMLKGSGRSIEAYNMFEELTKCRHLLERFGGHPMAAGLTLKDENLEQLRISLNRNTQLTDENLIPLVHIDIAMPIGYITEEFINELQLLEPFGKGNPKPIFAEKNFDIMKARILGKNKNVLKLAVRNKENYTMEALYFGDIEAFNHYLCREFGKEQMELMYRGEKNNIDLTFTYYPDINDYMGHKTLQIIIQGYR